MKRMITPLVMCVIALTTLSLSMRAETWSYDFEDFPEYSSATAPGSLNEFVLKGLHWETVGGRNSFDGNDWFNGKRSLRLYYRAPSTFTYAYFTMQNNRADGIGSVSFKYRAYARHSGSQEAWIVQSSNDGTNWTQEGEAFTPTMEVKSFTSHINKPNARIRIVPADYAASTSPMTGFVGAFNIDDLSISDYEVASPDKPSITTDKGILDFGQVDMSADKTLTLQVQTANLTDNVSITIQGVNASSFTSSVESLSKDGGVIQVTFRPSRKEANVGEIILQTSVGTETIKKIVSLSGIGFKDMENNPYSGGTGTETDPYLIASADDLVGLSISTNKYRKTYEKTYFRMTADIDLKGVNLTPIGLGGIGSDPSQYNKFCGHFDGDGHKILNFNYQQPNGWAGLFSHISGGGGIRNLTIASGSIASNEVTGGFCAMLVGGYIINCHTLPDVTVMSSFTFAGGICGGMLLGPNLIEKCTNQATVKNRPGGGGLDLGGIVGSASGSKEMTIRQCANFGDVAQQYEGAGGIVSMVENPILIEDCLNTAMVYASGQRAGGIVGTLGRFSAAGQVVIRNCYNVGEVTAEATPRNSAPIIYYIPGQGLESVIHVENSYYHTFNKPADYVIQIFGSQMSKEDMLAAAFVDKLNAGRSGNDAVWTKVEGGITQGYPTFKWATEVSVVQPLSTTKNCHVSLAGSTLQIQGAHGASTVYVYDLSGVEIMRSTFVDEFYGNLSVSGRPVIVVVIDALGIKTVLKAL